MLLRILLLQGFETDCFYINNKTCKTQLSEQADKRQISFREISSNRGSIFDRNGEILAMSVPKKTLCINFRKFHEPYIENKYDINAFLKIIITKIPRRT